MILNLIKFVTNDGVCYCKITDILADTVKILDKYFSSEGIERRIQDLLDEDDEVGAFWDNFITYHIN